MIGIIRCQLSNFPLKNNMIISVYSPTNDEYKLKCIINDIPQNKYF